MENSLFIKTDTSYTLNFLIYLQNMYLNQKQPEEQLKFPYMPIPIAFHKDFEVVYQALWKEASRKIAKYSNSDLHIFYKENELFYDGLFADSATDFHAIYTTFNVWWDSLAGRFSIERSIDERVEKVYTDLESYLTQAGSVPQKTLHISVLYDACLLANEEHFSYFSIVPIKDFFVQYKSLVTKLQSSLT